MNPLICLLVTLTMAGVDFCHAQYTRALITGHPFQASLWSVAQWTCASVGFVVAVKISIYYLPFEALGLMVGTYLGAQRFIGHDLQRRDQNQVPGLSEDVSSSEEQRDKRITGFSPPVSRGD